MTANRDGKQSPTEGSGNCRLNVLWRLIRAHQFVRDQVLVPLNEETVVWTYGGLDFDR